MLEQLGKDGLAKIHAALSQTCPTPPDPKFRIKSVNLNSNRSRLRPEVRPCSSLIWAEVGKFSPDSSDTLQYHYEGLPSRRKLVFSPHVLTTGDVSKKLSMIIHF